MKMRNTANSYGWVSIVLHWITALAVVSLFAAGLWIERLDYYDSLYQVVPHLHKSFGFLLVMLVCLRIIWRFTDPKPKLLESHKTWEVWFAKIAHRTLYVLLLLMLPTGYLITTAKGQGLDIFGWFTIPALISDIDNLEDIAGEIHELLAFSLIVIASFHALGALKHHFFDKDVTLKRMLGKGR